MVRQLRAAREPARDQGDWWGEKVGTKEICLHVRYTTLIYVVSD